jgi:hypothetical protein
MPDVVCQPHLDRVLQEEGPTSFGGTEQQPVQRSAHKPYPPLAPLAVRECEYVSKIEEILANFELRPESRQRTGAMATLLQTLERSAQERLQHADLRYRDRDYEQARGSYLMGLFSAERLPPADKTRVALQRGAGLASYWFAKRDSYRPFNHRDPPPEQKLRLFSDAVTYLGMALLQITDTSDAAKLRDILADAESELRKRSESAKNE